MKENADFDSSLAYGQLGEQLLRQVAKSYLEYGEDAVEVKTDNKVSSTGRLYIEKESRGKPSGISTSKAKYWALVLDGGSYSRQVFVIIETDRLRELCRLSGKGNVKGGDSDTSRGYLISLPTLLKPLLTMTV